MSAQPRLYRPDCARAVEPSYFTRVPNEAIEHLRLTPAQFRVYVYLLSCMRTDTADATAVVTQSQVAADLRLSDRTIRSAFNRLADVGLLAFERDYSRRGGPYRVTRLTELRSGPERKPVSGPERKPVSGPLLFEEREREERKIPDPGACEISAPKTCPEPKPAPVATRDARHEAEVERVAQMAEEVCGDVSWAIWVSRNARMGYPPEWIEAAIGEMVNQDPPRIRPDFGAGILRRYQREGGPRRRFASSHALPSRRTSSVTNMPYNGKNLPPDLHDQGEFALAPGEYEELMEKLRREGVIS